jgi:hypothetical protein
MQPSTLILPTSTKQLRHPNVLSFKDSLEVPDKGGAALYLVTEPARPLAAVLAELQLTGQHRCGVCWMCVCFRL